MKVEQTGKGSQDFVAPSVNILSLEYRYDQIVKDLVTFSTTVIVLFL